MDSIFIKENLHELSCLVKNGLKGKLKISGRNFEGQMPEVDLAPIEIDRRSPTSPIHLAINWVP